MINRIKKVIFMILCNDFLIKLLSENNNIFKYNLKVDQLL